MYNLFSQNTSVTNYKKVEDLVQDSLFFKTSCK